MLTNRSALVELMIVTVGVLIALSFDGVRGWMRERALLEDALTNLTSEVSANKSSVEGFLKAIPERERELEHVWDISTKMLAGESIEGTAALQIELMEITSAAYATTQLTGAFGLMPYEEVSRYSAVYAHQDRVREMQDQALTLLKSVTSRTWLLDDAKPPLAEVALWRQDIAATRTHLFFLKQFAEQLISKAYDPLLSTGR